MRTVKSSFFETKVRREAVTEEGTQCKLTELFVVSAMSFSECEARITEYVAGFASGGFEVLTECHAPYGEIFFSDDQEENIFYKAKVAFVTLDDRTGKEKKSKVTYLVQGSSVASATKNINEVLGDSMMDFVIEGVHETAITDIVNAEPEVQ